MATTTEINTFKQKLSTAYSNYILKLSKKEKLGVLKVDYRIKADLLYSYYKILMDYLNPVTSYNYGLLYNGYVISNSAGVAPTDWHVPTNTEFQTLSTFLGGDTISGGSLKSIDTWVSPNTGADNSSGFTALGTGLRNSDGSFSSYKGYNTLFWTDTTGAGNARYYRYLLYNSAAFNSVLYSQLGGASIRCLKDDPIDWKTGDTVTDINGNIYNTIKIGTQIWMLENLRTTSYSDGTPINNLSNTADWIATTDGAYCNFNNNTYVGVDANFFTVTEARDILEHFNRICNTTITFIDFE